MSKVMVNLELAGTKTPDIVARFELLDYLCQWFVMEAIKAPSNLNPQMVLVLGRMAKFNQPMSHGELRTRGFYIGSNVSYNLKRLERLGYVKSQKNEEDKRGVILTLTEKGQRIGDRAAKVIQYLDKHISSVFSPEAFRKAKGFLGETVHDELDLSPSNPKAREHQVAEA